MSWRDGPLLSRPLTPADYALNRAWERAKKAQAELDVFTERNHQEMHARYDRYRSDAIEQHAKKSGPEVGGSDGGGGENP